MKRPPPLSITLDFVYGFQAYDKRKTLFYVHLYSWADKAEKKKGKGKGKKGDVEPQSSVLIPDYMKKEMLFSKNKLLPYDDTHDHCQRLFVYFTSRMAIVYNPATHKQTFYEGHKYKITCLSIHPSSFHF